MTVVLDGAASTPYDPHGRTMHELSHIADFVSAPNQGRGQDPGIDYLGVSGHNLDTQENTTVAMSEGFAHFFAATALYSQSATVPRICTGVDGSSASTNVQTCWGATIPLQFSLEAPGTCAAGNGRREINAAAFFWDLHDTVQENFDIFFNSIFILSDTLATASCASYPACYGSNQLHDAWTLVSSPLDLDPPTTSTVGESDKNGTLWYSSLYNASSGFNTSGLTVQDCLNFL